ncbi:MAG: hypothetical protein ACI8TS_000780 [Flavobacteriales bacterium]|jgi:hypothetical protein
MKRNLSTLLINLALVSLTIVAIGCGEKSIAEKDVRNPEASKVKAESLEETIIGNWQMTAFNIIDPNVGEMALDYARNIAPTVKYVFKADGEYEVTTKTILKPKKGIWKKGVEKNQIFVQIGNEPKMLISVDKQEENHLWCRTQTPGLGNITFQLIRIEE